MTPWTAAHKALLSISNSQRHPVISSSVIPFPSWLQSFPASGSFPMSQFFTSGGQSIGVQLQHFEFTDWSSRFIIIRYIACSQNNTSLSWAHQMFIYSSKTFSKYPLPYPFILYYYIINFVHYQPDSLIKRHALQLSTCF